MARRARRRWWWGLAVIAWVGVASLALGPDPGFRITQAESFAVRAVDVSGHRHPIATFDGRSLADRSATPARRSAGARSAGDCRPRNQRRRAGLHVRVFAASGERWALGPAGGRSAGDEDRGHGRPPAHRGLDLRAGRRRRQCRSTWTSPCEPRSRAGRERWSAPGCCRRTAASRSCSARGKWPSAATTSTCGIPRRHPLGIAVAGRGGIQTWVMYNRSPAGDSFELAAVGRRGLRELPPIPRGVS